MTTTLPTRQQVETASDLDFDAQRSASKAHISIEIAPDGLHITAEYLGTLGSIPTAVKRLVDAGLVELVNTHRAAPITTSTRQKAAERLEPAYKPDGTPCCPVHHTALSTGQYGPYCSAKAKPGEAANAKGYCSLRFSV